MWQNSAVKEDGDMHVSGPIRLGHLRDETVATELRLPSAWGGERDTAHGA